MWPDSPPPPPRTPPTATGVQPSGTSPEAGLTGLECGALSADRVGYGSSVVLQNLDNRQRVSYTLVTGDVIDLGEDQVSLASPVGQALLGRKVGDSVSVETPAGTLRYRIVSVTTLPQMLGLMPACA